MAKFKLMPSVEFQVHMILTEEQAIALSELASYNIQDMVDKITGDSSVLAKSSKGLVNFLEDCRDNIKPQLSKIKASRNALNE